MNCFNFLVTEEASSLGTLLSGIAQVITLFVAVWVVYREIPIWRKREIDKRKIDTAGRTFVAVERLFRALDFITSIRVDESPEKDHKHRLEITKNELNSFISQWPESKIYLSEETNNKLSELWRLWSETNTNIEMHLSLSEYRDGTFYNESFG